LQVRDPGDDFANSSMIKIQADKIEFGFANSHLQKKFSIAEADLQFQRMIVAKMGLPVRVGIGIQKKGAFILDFIKRNQRL
jgi:hypothetical protein